MSIYDRDYMRENDSEERWKPGYLLKRWLTIAILAVSLLTSAVWLARTFGLWRGHGTETFGKLSLRVNINLASQEELETLPGIGPVRGRSIIDHRPYKSADELLGRKAIGKRVLEDIRPYVKTDGKTEKLKRSN
jgi:hypothetical protein